MDEGLAFMNEEYLRTMCNVYPTWYLICNRRCDRISIDTFRSFSSRHAMNIYVMNLLVQLGGGAPHLRSSIVRCFH